MHLNERIDKNLSDWERRALVELYHEYEYILRSRRIQLRPAVIELFDSDLHWGEWCSDIRTIRLSRKLLTKNPWFHVLAILKHEMAHQYVDEAKDVKFIKNTPHGDAFQNACTRLGVPLEFSKASVNLQKNSLDWRNSTEEKRDEASEKLLEKTRKLLALASSGNEHEALLAMNRVRQIYARHSLDQLSSMQKPEFVHLVILKGNSRLEAFEKKIISILVGHFFVQVITSKTYDLTSGAHHRLIEIIGTKENALMAEYVYHFLSQQSASLVQKRIDSTGIKLSRIEKKSYRWGILEGFEEKLSLIEDAPTNDIKSGDPEAQENIISKALVQIKNDPGINKYISRIYPRLGILRSGAQMIDGSIYNDGKSVGRKIVLNKVITGNSGFIGRLLSGK